jgi:2-polyprenyl-6-methoxyphenol hydroxylase-like FAD-dependent oxidoreductase
MYTSFLGKHAVVIGGSISGLLTSRMLSNYFEKVTVIERDRFPENVASRKGFPQASHIHSLMLRGRIILDELFPGIEEELIHLGAQRFDMGSDMTWLTPAGWGKNWISGLDIIAFSRDLLDWIIRNRLKEFSNISILEGCQVKELIAHENKIKGVSLYTKSLDSNDTSSIRIIDADLVVDASGNSSKAPQWLKTLGLIPPSESVVDPSLKYATRLYRMSSLPSRAWKAFYVQPAPPISNRGAITFSIEGDRCIFSFMLSGEQIPPKTEEEFLEFASSLENNEIYRVIKNAEALSPVAIYHAPANRRRYYEYMKEFLEGFVVLGDAVCTLSPIYGQGMTVAALGVKLLDKCLQLQLEKQPENLIGLASLFQKQLSKINNIPWDFVISQDERYPNCKSSIYRQSPTSMLKAYLMRWYLDQVIKLTTYNTKVRMTLFEVMHMVKTPEAFFQPEVLLPVLQQLLKFPAKSNNQLRDLQEINSGFTQV